MKTYFTSALLFCALTSAPALAQSKTAVRPAAPAKTTTAVRSSTAAKTTAAKPTTSTAAKTTAKPAAKPAVKPTAATSASKPAATTPTIAVETTSSTTTPAAESTVIKKSTATNQIFGKGSMAVNLGVGLGLGYGYGLSGLHSTPAMSASFEYGVENLGPGTIGAGGMVGYKSYGWKSGSYKGTWSNIIVAARGTYHYDLLEDPKLDTYAGLSLGVRHERYSDNSGNDLYYAKASSTYITSGIFVGGRYFFSDKLGAFGEVGYDMSYLKLGLTAKF